MKVVQINSVCGVGSTGRIAVDISKKLNDEGIENLIFYGVGDSDYKHGIKFGGKRNVRTHQLGTRLLGKHGFYSKHATKDLVEKLKEFDPDIVHLHNIHGHYLNVEVLFKYLKSSNKKVIWTLHDCWSFTGHCAHFDFIGCTKWKTECNNCPQLKEYPISLFFDRSKEAFNDKKRLFNDINEMTIVTPSFWLKNLVSESFLQNYSVKVINTGIDLDLFKPSKNNFKEERSIQDKFMILGVANFWGRRKGFNHFIELSKNLRSDEVIVIVGVTNEQIQELPENIIGIKRTNSIEELAEIYSAADVFINPTLEDTFPTTNLEAMACGTPIITFNTGGSPESVNKKTGLVVEKDNLKVLIDAKNDIREMNFCKRNISDYAQKYSINNMVCKYLSLYQLT